jgi:hypothetical protein
MCGYNRDKVETPDFIEIGRGRKRVSLFHINESLFIYFSNCATSEDENNSTESARQKKTWTVPPHDAVSNI